MDIVLMFESGPEGQQVFLKMDEMIDDWQFPFIYKYISMCVSVFLCEKI